MTRQMKRKRRIIWEMEKVLVGGGEMETEEMRLGEAKRAACWAESNLRNEYRRIKWMHLHNELLF